MNGSPHTRARILPPLLVAALSLLGGCDPCFGVSTCRGGPVLAYQGEFVESDGNPAGIEVTFVRTGGVELETDSVRVMTDDERRFRIRIPAMGAGEVVGDFFIRGSSSLGPYRISDVRLMTTRDGNLLTLPPWLAFPTMAYVGELFLRTNSQPAANAQVEFRRVSGIAVAADTIRAISNADGRFWITPRPLEVGELVAEMEVRLPGTDIVYVAEDLRLASDPVAGSVRILRVATGPNWWYVAEVRWAGTGEPAGGVEVEFVRTGGEALTGNSFTSTTDADGLVALRPPLADPLARGEVVGDITIRPPAPHPTVRIENVTLTSIDEDGERFLAEWEVGQG
jgi:hypothetical protein